MLPEMPSKLSTDPKTECNSSYNCDKGQIHEFSRLPEMSSKLSTDPKTVCNSSYNREKGSNPRVFKTVRNALEAVDGTQNSMQWLIKLRERTKSTSFHDCQKCPQNCRRTPKQYAVAHITAREDQIHEFRYMPEMPSKLSTNPKTECNSSYNCEKGPNPRVFTTARNALETVDGPQNSMQ